LDVGYDDLIKGFMVFRDFIIPFSTGSHDWEYRQIVVPANSSAIIAIIL